MTVRVHPRQPRAFDTSVRSLVEEAPQEPCSEHQKKGADTELETSGYSGGKAEVEEDQRTPRQENRAGVADPPTQPETERLRGSRTARNEGGDRGDVIGLESVTEAQQQRGGEWEETQSDACV